MKKLTIIFFLTTVSLFAGTTNEEFAEITGVVRDIEFREPIPYATISVKNTDGEIVTGTVSSADGAFKIEELQPGNYILEVQFMGYKKFFQEVKISSAREDIELGTIYLEAEVAQLDNVEIVAERSTIEQRIDRKVIHVGKDLTTAGPTASDIMGNLPTLTVDLDGNISMRGNDNVRILVDGKPTNIPTAQLLKQIPSSSIKSIELITNPSAKYNPEGMSGIINIVLHKSSNLGFHGNFSGGVAIGEYTRYNTSLNLNYRTGKFNFYGNFGTNGGERLRLGRMENLTNSSVEKTRFVTPVESYLFKVGVDFYLNDKNIFSIYTTQNIYQADATGEVDILFRANPALNTYQDFSLYNDDHSRTYNFDYRRLFAKEDHMIELEVDYSTFEGSEVAHFLFEGAGTELKDYRDDISDNISNTTINLDYTNPLTKVSELEVGAEARWRYSNNSYRSSNIRLDDVLHDYDNSIFSFYSTFGQKYDQWAYQLGVRLEQYVIEAVYNGERVFEDEYFTAYPSFFFSYELSEIKSLQLSYSRRVDRPSLSQVNPVREFFTQKITRVGNPELEPQFTNSVELNYTHNTRKGSFTGGVFYRNIQNDISMAFITDPEDPTGLLLTFLNREDNNSYGLELSGRYKPIKWWSINPSFEIYRSMERGVLGLEQVEVENTAWNIKINQSIEASKRLTFELFALYNSPWKTIQLESRGMYFFNAGARYSFLEDKATLNLSVNDIFHTQKSVFDTEFPYRQRGTFLVDSRRVHIGLSYRFGGGKNRALQRKQRDDNTAQGGGIL